MYSGCSFNESSPLRTILFVFPWHLQQRVILQCLALYLLATHVLLYMNVNDGVPTWKWFCRITRFIKPRARHSSLKKKTLLLLLRFLFSSEIWNLCFFFTSSHHWLLPCLQPFQSSLDIYQLVSLHNKAVNLYVRQVGRMAQYWRTGLVAEQH